MADHITRYMLKQQIAQVNRESLLGTGSLTSPSSTSTNNNPINIGDVKTNISISEKRITKIKGDIMIAADGTEAKLFSPIPGISYECRGAIAANGITSLEKELTGLFLRVDNTSYCLGVSGATNEFDIKIQVDTNLFEINRDFINMKYNHLIKNGVEKNE